MDYQAVFKRYELKYILDPEQYDAVVDVFEGRMKVDKYGATQIHNIYYDTPDYLLIRRSIEHPKYKEKLRIRSYGCAGGDDKIFVEIKKKYEGIVYKRRITMKCNDVIDWLDNGKASCDDSQISHEIDYMRHIYTGLMPRMGLNYLRRAYYPVDDIDLRITIDEDINASVENPSLGTERYDFSVLPEGYHLMEIKTPGFIPLWFTRVMCDKHIWKNSFSKYGSAYKQMILGKTFTEVTGLPVKQGQE